MTTWRPCKDSSMHSQRNKHDTPVPIKDSDWQRHQYQYYRNTINRQSLSTLQQLE